MTKLGKLVPLNKTHISDLENNHRKKSDSILELSKRISSLSSKKDALIIDIDVQDRRIADLECEYYEFHGIWPRGFPASATKKYRPEFIKRFP